MSNKQQIACVSGPLNELGILSLEIFVTRNLQFPRVLFLFTKSKTRNFRVKCLGGALPEIHLETGIPRTKQEICGVPRSYQAGSMAVFRLVTPREAAHSSHPLHRH